MNNNFLKARFLIIALSFVQISFTAYDPETQLMIMRSRLARTLEEFGLKSAPKEKVMQITDAEAQGAFELLQEEVVKGIEPARAVFSSMMKRNNIESAIYLRNQKALPRSTKAVARPILAAAALQQKPVMVKNKSDALEEKDDYVFVPRMGKSSLDKVQYQGKSLASTIIQRINSRWQGDIPDQVVDLVNYCLNQKWCIKNKYGCSNRLLVYGEPGVGKSYLAEVLAGELEVPMFSVSASIFKDKYIGVAAQRIRNLFAAANALDRFTIIFIDEIDTIATQRNGKTDDEHRNTLMALLNELDAVKENPNILIYAATNVDPFAEAGVDRTTTLSATPFGIGASKSWTTHEKCTLDRALTSRFPAAICKIKGFNKSQRSEALMQLFQDKGLDPVLAHKGLADVLVCHIPASVSPRCMDEIVAKAQLKYGFGNLSVSKKCICVCFNEVLKNSRETYCNGLPVSIKCIH